MAVVRPKKQVSEKDRKVGEVIKDATTPLLVNNALNDLARRNGTERVLAAAKEWVAYIDRQKARAGYGHTRGDAE